MASLKREKAGLLEKRKEKETKKDGEYFIQELLSLLQEQRDLDQSDLLALLEKLDPCLVELVKEKVNIVLDYLSKTIGKENERDIEFLKNLCQSLSSNVTSLLAIFEYIKSLPSRTLSASLLLVAVLKMITQVLQLCKDIESNYGNNGTDGSLIVDIFSVLFKSTVSLLKVSCSLAEELIRVIDVIEKYKPHLMLNILNNLCCVGVVCLQFDPALILLSWKPFGKLFCSLKDHTSLWEGQEDILEQMMHKMCLAMLVKGRDCITSSINKNDGGGSLFGKLLKICRFFATLIVKVVQEYSSYEFVFSETMFCFLLEIISYLPPSLTALSTTTTSSNTNTTNTLPSSIVAQLESNITILCEPVVCALLKSESFLQLITTVSEITTKYCYSWSWLLCCLLKSFAKLEVKCQSYLMEPLSAKQSASNSCRLLEAIFNCITKCYLEFSLPVKLPGVAIIGQSVCNVTLYEYLYVHVCGGLVAVLPSQYYKQLESVLLDQLLSSNVYCSLFAMDVWSFLARWSSSEMCWHHLQLLSHLILSLSLPLSISLSSLNVVVLFRRLFAFLTPQQQDNYIKENQPSSYNIHLWTHVPLHVLQDSLIEEVTSLLGHCCINALLIDGQSFINLITSLKCLQNLLSDDRCKPHLLPHLPIDHLLMILSMGLDSKQLRHEYNSLLLYHTLVTVSLILNTLNSKQLIKVLTCVYWLGQSKVRCIIMGVATLLTSCGLLTDPIVKEPLSAIFNVLLGAELPWLPKHYVFDAFKQFAESTPFTDILEISIPSFVSEQVVDFIQKIPIGSRCHQEILHESYIIECLKNEQNQQETHQEQEELIQCPSPPFSPLATCTTATDSPLCDQVSKEEEDICITSVHDSSDQSQLFVQFKEAWSQLHATLSVNPPSPLLIQQLTPIWEQMGRYLI